MKHFLLLITSCLLCSCGGNILNKEYQYIEIVKEPNLIGSGYTEKREEPKTISAKNDSIAFTEAVKRFFISQKVYEDMKKKGVAAYLAIPIDFELINEAHEEVVVSLSPEYIEDLYSRIMGLDTSSSSSESTSKESISSIDSTKIKELSPKFTFKKDEFDPKGLTWIEPKSSPKYSNQNGIYCYFMRQDDTTSNFRLKIQYYASDWLFIEKIQFSIDDKAYEYNPSKTERDHGGGYIWEWSDEKISYESDKNIIEALANAKSAKMKLIGSQYYKIKNITPAQITSIRESLELYKAMGGKW